MDRQELQSRPVTVSDFQFELVDNFIGLSDHELDLLVSLARHDASTRLSLVLSAWLLGMIEQERRRREGRIANYPVTLVSNDWTPTQAANALTLAILWLRTPISGRMEHLHGTILRIVGRQCASRLVEFEDMKNERETNDAISHNFSGSRSAERLDRNG